MAVDDDFTRGWEIHCTRQIEQSRFTAATAANERDNLTRLDSERDAVERTDLVIIARVIFEDVSEFDQPHRADFSFMNLQRKLRAISVRRRSYFFSVESSFSMLATTCGESGVTSGSNRATGCPSGPMRN